MEVQVVPYDPSWPSRYRREAALLREALGDCLVEIHHIGSTSVPGLWAKPIIDILPVVTAVEEADRRRAALEALGYEYLGEFGIPGRRYLRKGGDHRTHQVHLFGRESRDEIRRHLAVPAYLRCHPDAARDYAQLKRRLARRFPRDIDGYCDGKDAFVKALERAALDWWETAGPGKNL
ncbi:MAG TPA: GrpB family protein [Firmicutes bacterium]|nr:GrpB family protein [Bacillota bacterium]